MAIELLETLKTGKENPTQSNIHIVCNICEEALEQPEPRMFLDLSNSNGNHPVEQPAQEPFGYWHVGETEEECDFFLYEESGDVTEYCDTCIKLYTHPAPSCQECENLKHDLEGYMDANKELINLLNKL